ncbi:hypothetical protein [Marinobacter salarius]|uniref:hypothetical protein n=1 Tax=Marinobacter salarius TaxID=1420917 RepID=UPI003D1399A7
MEMNELIHKLEKARTKDDIEALGKEHLDIDVDKRKNKEILRAELLGEAEARAAAEGEQTPSPDESQDAAADQGPENEPASADEESGSDPEAAPEVTPGPSAEPPKDSEPEAERSRVKMGRNRKTGRVMPWTAAMAKMRHMEEM